MGSDTVIIHVCFRPVERFAAKIRKKIHPAKYFLSKYRVQYNLIHEKDYFVGVRYNLIREIDYFVGVRYNLIHEKDYFVGVRYNLIRVIDYSAWRDII